MEIVIKIISFIVDALSNWGDAPNDMLTACTNAFAESLDNCKEIIKLEDISGIVIPIGLALLIIYFSIDLMQKVANTNFTIEVLIRSFTKFIIGFALISNCYLFSDVILQLSNQLITDLGKQYNNSMTYQFGGDYKEIMNYLKDAENVVMTKKQTAALFTKFLIQFLMAWTINLILMCVAYARAIKIIIYEIFLPLSISDIFGNGIYGGGMRNFKNLFALYLQYPLVYIIILFIIILSNSDAMSFGVGNWMAYAGQLFMIMIVAGRIIKNSYQEAKALF